MCRIALVLAAMLIASQASAEKLDWNGTLDLELWQGSAVVFRGSGVATVANGTGGGAQLGTLRLAGGIAGAGTVPVTDPDSTGTIKSVRVSANLGTGTLSGISSAPPLNPPAALPVPLYARLCIFLTPDCPVFLPLNLTSNGGNTGVGVGGLATLGRFRSTRISIEAAPWTLGTVTGLNQTVGGGFKTLSRKGFVHGAGSGNSSTATGSGVIQMITPQRVTTQGLPGNSTQVALFTTLTLHFIPEPGLLLLIASGVVALVLVGRSRMEA